MSRSRPQLVVVSARAPYVSAGGVAARAPGGVISALLPVLRRVQGLWFATGAETDAEPASEPAFRVEPIPLDGATRAAWYLGACNGAIWPLAHGQLERCRFARSEWEAYVEVNRAVAAAVAAGAEAGATVWIHDYQLALVPDLLRRGRADLRIGFFWHIPWPAAELLRSLPWADELVRGILGADLVGLHVPRYVRAFEDMLHELHELRGEGPIAWTSPRPRAARDEPRAARSGSLRALVEGRPVHVAACPIGVDVACWSALATHPGTARDARALRRAWGAARVLLAVDRLDYTKGIVERLEAFERALEQDPTLREAVTLVQVGVPTRERLGAYRDLRERVEAAVGRINGRFGDATRVPVRFLATCLSSAELAAYYTAADAALVTPLRDGMNLVAFEYVATRVNRTGRLLLSNTAGAADVLPEATLVNPYDEEGFTAALARVAREAETAVDAARMGSLRERVLGRPIEAWIDRFLGELEPAFLRPPGRDRAVGGRLREAS